MVSRKREVSISFIFEAPGFWGEKVSGVNREALRPAVAAVLAATKAAPAGPAAEPRGAAVAPLPGRGRALLAGQSLKRGQVGTSQSPWFWSPLQCLPFDFPLPIKEMCQNTKVTNLRRCLFPFNQKGGGVRPTVQTVEVVLREPALARVPLPKKLELHPQTQLALKLWEAERRGFRTPLAVVPQLLELFFRF